MCTLYNMLTTTEAMQQLRAEWERVVRNMPPLYGVYPDYFAPICTMAGDQQVMKLARWGLPLRDVLSLF